MLEILVADDHELMRQGVKGLLEAEPNWHVCAQASDGREAVALAASVAPDVAILDLTMPELNGLEATRQILKVSPPTVLKTDAAKDLVSAVAALAAGSPYLSVRMSRARADSARSQGGSRARVLPLTTREREITQLLAEGKSNWCVAKILAISIKTVETHRGNIMHKLGLESIVELVHYAVRNQIVSP